MALPNTSKNNLNISKNYINYTTAVAIEDEKLIAAVSTIQITVKRDKLAERKNFKLPRTTDETEKLAFNIQEISRKAKVANVNARQETARVLERLQLKYGLNGKKKKVRGVKSVKTDSKRKGKMPNRATLKNPQRSAPLLEVDDAKNTLNNMNVNMNEQSENSTADDEEIASAPSTSTQLPPDNADGMTFLD